jgi:hypothetical protein
MRVVRPFTCIILAVAALFVPQRAEARKTHTSLAEIERGLGPHGRWLEIEGADRAWMPDQKRVGMEFRPYVSQGHWVSSPKGWIFHSDFDWLQPAFHYGRWWQDARWGWVWIPDAQWAPAWVEWRNGAGYTGWIPKSPAGLTYDNDVLYRNWAFVPDSELFARNLKPYLVAPSWATTYFGNTVEIPPASGAAYSAGPSPALIAKAARAPVPLASQVDHVGKTKTAHKAPVRKSHTHDAKQAEHAQTGTGAADKDAHASRKHRTRHHTSVASHTEPGPAEHEAHRSPDGKLTIPGVGTFSRTVPESKPTTEAK